MANCKEKSCKTCVDRKYCYTLLTSKDWKLSKERAVEMFAKVEVCRMEKFVMEAGN